MPKYYNKNTKKFEEKGSSDKVVTGKGKLFGFKDTRKVNRTMSDVRKKTGKTEADLKKMSASELKRAGGKKTMKPTSSPASKGAMADKSATKWTVGESKGGVSFNKAFKHFKDQGAKEFTWNGKRYNTKTK